MKANRLKTTVKPEKFENLGNGIYYYNYDVNTSIQTNSDTDNDEEIYDFIQVRIAGQPTYKACVKAVIRAYVSLEEEFDFINSHNSAIFKVSTNSVDKDNYIQYLTLLAEIKEKVKADFK